MILPQGYYKMFFWKNLLLMKLTPILDQAVFNFPPNVGKRFNIHSKILKKPFPTSFQLRKKVVIFTILSSLTDLFHEPRFSLFSILSEYFLKQ